MNSDSNFVSVEISCVNVLYLVFTAGGDRHAFALRESSILGFLLSFCVLYHQIDLF